MLLGLNFLTDGGLDARRATDDPPPDVFDRRQYRRMGRRQRERPVLASEASETIDSAYYAGRCRRVYIPRLDRRPDERCTINAGHDDCSDDG